MPNWHFMAVINSDTFNEGRPWFRLFGSEIAACGFIEDQHELGWDYRNDKPKDGLFESAAVYRILKSGKCELVQNYSTVADSSGEGEGWL